MGMMQIARNTYVNPVTEQDKRDWLSRIVEEALMWEYPVHRTSYAGRMFVIETNNAFVFDGTATQAEMNEFLRLRTWHEYMEVEVPDDVLAAIIERFPVTAVPVDPDRTSSGA